MISILVKLKDAAALLGVSHSYLCDVVEDRLDKKRYPQATHSRLLSDFFFKETNNRWYIARSILDRHVSERNAAVLHRDPERAAATHKRLRELGL
jgi:hypothetical protein